MYKLKRGRNFKVVLKHIHTTVNVDDIRKELKIKDIQLLMYGSKNKTLTNPMFSVVLEPESNYKNIYEVKSLLQYKIKFKLPHRKIPSIIASSMGHTRNLCFSICIKYAEDHPIFN
jgi:hypothetical protein